MELGLSGRRVIITGGSGTIGSATAQLFLAEGARVAICGRDAGRLKRAAGALDHVPPSALLTIVADVREAGDVQHLVDVVVKDWDGVDVLVNMAGTNVRGRLDSLDPGALWSALETRLLGYMACIRCVLPHMRRAGGGRIVNVVGQAAKSPQPSALPAAATNAAVLAASKALADGLAAEHIAVNVVCPMGVESPLVAEIALEQAEARGVDQRMTRDELIGRLPLGRLASPAEIADVIAFAASQRATFVTGTTLDVDGGYQRYIV
jgi:NAD(P)-dependent dehydrogenase (short-subunit alcohol dehydrogenase family)